MYVITIKPEVKNIVCVIIRRHMPFWGKERKLGKKPPYIPLEQRRGVVRPRRIDRHPTHEESMREFFGGTKTEIDAIQTNDKVTAVVINADGNLLERQGGIFTRIRSSGQGGSLEVRGHTRKGFEPEDAHRLAENVNEDLASLYRSARCVGRGRYVGHLKRSEQDVAFYKDKHNRIVIEPMTLEDAANDPNIGDG